MEGDVISNETVANDSSHDGVTRDEMREMAEAAVEKFEREEP
jgi:hypothetical protein